MSFYTIFMIIPLLLGIFVRVLFGKSKKGWLLTVIFALFTSAAIIIAYNPPVIGSELYGLRALQLGCITAGAAGAGVFVRSRKR